VPDGVANLAQTRHTRPARHGKIWPSPAHCRPTESVLPPLPGDLTHDRLVHNNHSFELSSGRPRHPSPFRVRLRPSTRSVCNNRFRTGSRSGYFRLAGGEG
jgi:hypothetical protein